MDRIQPHIILKTLLENNLIDEENNSRDYKLYGFGNEYELKAKMRINNFKVTPLIWFELPYDNQTQTNNSLNCNIKMFLAASTDKSWQNEQRYAETYTKVLNPLYNKIERLLKKSLSFLIEDSQIITNEMPNYYTSQIGSRSNPEKQKTEAYWDVLTLSFSAKVTNKCENDKIL